MDTKKTPDPNSENDQKRVKWAPSIVEHTKSDRFAEITHHNKADKESFNPKEVVAILNKLFIKQNYKIANNYIMRYGANHQDQLLSAENYDLFKRAALRSDLMTLKFIQSKVGDDHTKIMVEDHEYAAFENFLTNECSHKKEKTNYENKIEIFKFFLHICNEDIIKIFEQNIKRFKMADEIKNALQKDFQQAYEQWKKATEVTTLSSSSFVDKYRNSSLSPAPMR